MRTQAPPIRPITIAGLLLLRAAIPAWADDCQVPLRITERQISDRDGHEIDAVVFLGNAACGRSEGIEAIFA